MTNKKSEPLTIGRRMLVNAKRQCTAARALPADWDDWFPETIQLRLGAGSRITVRDIVEYSRVRMTEDVEDPLRFIEAAQCLALIHFLGSPPLDTIVITRFSPEEMTT
jgi:hypothetical protein